MEVAFDSSTSPLSNYSIPSQPQSTNEVLVNALLSDNTDSAETNVDIGSDPSAFLGLNAKKIYDAIQEAIKQYSPKADEVLDQDGITPESSAQFIVSGIALLFDAYAKSNPELDPKDQIEKFITAARSGVQTGYDDAYNILDGLGAFSIDGVKSGVEQTKVEIEKGLVALEKYLKEKLGVASDETKENTTTEQQIPAAA